MLEVDLHHFGVTAWSLNIRKDVYWESERAYKMPTCNTLIYLAANCQEKNRGRRLFEPLNQAGVQMVGLKAVQPMNPPLKQELMCASQFDTIASPRLRLRLISS